MRKMLVIITTMLIVLLAGCKSKENDVVSGTLPVSPIESFGIDRSIPPSTQSNIETEEPLTTEELVIETQPLEIESSTYIYSTETEDVVSSSEDTVSSSEDVLEETTFNIEYTFEELQKYMYVSSPVNVRTSPDIFGEILFAFEEINHACWVTGRCIETGWYRIDIEGQAFYVCDDYLCDEKIVETKQDYVVEHTQSQQYIAPASGYVYYTVSGARPNAEYEKYLYNRLDELGLSWWYLYAVAQIFQESRWNPNSTNGRDHGICQFKGETFVARAEHHAHLYNADIWNPYDSLYVYAYYIRDILVAVNYNIYDALAYYITGNFGVPHDDYYNRVMGWYNSLQAE